MCDVAGRRTRWQNTGNQREAVLVAFLADLDNSNDQTKHRLTPVGQLLYNNGYVNPIHHHTQLKIRHLSTRERLSFLRWRRRTLQQGD